MRFKQVIVFSTLLATTTILVVALRQPAKISDEFRPLNWQELQLKSLNLNSTAELPLRGPVIIHYWASWCAPCQNEFPALLKNAPRLNGRLKIVLLSADDDEQAAREFLSRFAIPPSWSVVWDRLKTSRSVYSISQYPETWVFDEQLRFRRKISGVINWSQPKNLAYFNSL